jgi:DNA-binding MarR family transcriptional regulator
MAEQKYSRTAGGAALMDVIVLTFAAGFKLRALGRRSGLVSARGGVWGLMRSLRLGGPQTVPDLARTRPVARQHIQKLADEMAAQGLVAFAPNPAHKRSQLVRLTPAGERLFDQLTRRLARMADEIAEGMDARKLSATAETLAALAAKVDARLGEADAVDEDDETPRRRRA